MISHSVQVMLFLSFFLTICDAKQEEFTECMSIYSAKTYIKSFKYIHAPSSKSYFNLLQSAEQNPRWLNSTPSELRFIITPYNADEIRAAILCSKKHGLQLRIMSGGHDYEGLSFLCRTPYIIIDFINLRSISIDVEKETAWIQSGATLGELYYNIAKKSGVLGFPAGVCPSVGIGGHFSGGGIGTMVRKYGLAADNIIDAYFMDVDGRILDRKSMGEDLFWAIRGGGGGSFGVIIGWKIKLVRVPQVVTVFTLHKTLNQEGIGLVRQWQSVATKLPKDLFIRVVIQGSEIDGKPEQKVVEVLFNSLFLGPINELIPLMKERFPELGLTKKNCSEMSWIESVMYFTGYQQSDPLELLLDRTVQYKSYFKAKSDFVEKPIPENAFEGIQNRFLQEKLAFLIMDPFGGRMEEIPESQLPFPHRKGNLFNIQYLVKWVGNGDTNSKKHEKWIRDLYDYMEPYVSTSPRAAYINYRDLDIGVNIHKHNISHSHVNWGKRYFKENFKRLAEVKNRIDPQNFFRHEQSIPLLV
ncbi:tetrahydrocannabinolic acid synthase-like [Dorcoceras hygrometricum]|uniref:Tetrahydrocannabinolic acid synthase-like n=1 Tax=Dorcoceras hygrometricum TaxID=472368 RepID=A0A2Z7AIM9_9LAMI|nr:tetrahydrocannabinolic acid synthase-like [Dorcoceras hygrometricum]